MSQQINLFNPAFQPQKHVLSSAQLALAAAVVVVGIGAVALVGNMGTAELQQQASAGALALEQRQARLASVNTEFAPRQKDPTIDGQIVDADRRLTAMRHISGALARGELGDTNGFAGVFKALARQHMQGLWLTGVTVGASGAQIGIRGRAVDPAMVPGYLNRLTREPLMQGKSFASLQIGEAAPLPLPLPQLSPVSSPLRSPNAGADGVSGTRPAPYVEFSLQSVVEEPRP
jgi:hypothetical protein